MREEVKRQLPPDTEQDTEQVLMAVQDQLLEELFLKNEAGLEVKSRGLQASDFAEAKENLVKEREGLVSCLGEEWQEKRFLRFGFFACFSSWVNFSLFKVLGSSR